MKKTRILLFSLCAVLLTGCGVAIKETIGIGVIEKAALSSDKNCHFVLLLMPYHCMLLSRFRCSSHASKSSLLIRTRLPTFITLNFPLSAHLLIRLLLTFARYDASLNVRYPRQVLHNHLPGPDETDSVLPGIFESSLL